MTDKIQIYQPWSTPNSYLIQDSSGKASWGKDPDAKTFNSWEEAQELASTLDGIAYVIMNGSITPAEYREGDK